MIPKDALTKKMYEIMLQRPLVHDDPRENINELLKRWNDLRHFVTEYQE